MTNEDIAPGLNRRAQSDLGGLASCDLVAGENIDIESSGDRWTPNEVRNELVHPRIFFMCVALGILLTLPKAQRKDLVGLGIRHKENLVHESRLVFKDWEDLMANGLSKLPRFSLLGPDGDDSGKHSGLLLFESWEAEATDFTHLALMAKVVPYGDIEDCTQNISGEWKTVPLDVSRSLYHSSPL